MNLISAHASVVDPRVKDNVRLPFFFEKSGSGAAVGKHRPGSNLRQCLFELPRIVDVLSHPRGSIGVRKK